MTEAEAFVAGRRSRTSTGDDVAWRAAAPGRRLLVQQHRPLEPTHAVAPPCRTRSARRWATTRSAAAAATSPGTPKTTRSRSPTGTILLRDIKLYLLTVLRTANRRRPALRLAGAAAEFIETIDAYQARAGKHFDLSPAKAEATALAQALAGVPRKAERGHNQRRPGQRGDVGTGAHSGAAQFHPAPTFPA